MAELLVDFITTLDGCASGDGWPGFWGLDGLEYLAWLGKQPEVTYLMGANTCRLMLSFATGEVPDGVDELRPEEEASVDELTRARKLCSRTRWRSRSPGRTRRSCAASPSRSSAS